MECRALPPIAKALHDLVVGLGVEREALTNSELFKLYVDSDKFNKNISAINKADGVKGKKWDFKAG